MQGLWRDDGSIKLKSSTSAPRNYVFLLNSFTQQADAAIKIQVRRSRGWLQHASCGFRQLTISGNEYAKSRQTPSTATNSAYSVRGEHGGCGADRLLMRMMTGRAQGTRNQRKLGQGAKLTTSIKRTTHASHSLSWCLQV
jgi:hypothetical protein